MGISNGLQLKPQVNEYLFNRDSFGVYPEHELKYYKIIRSEAKLEYKRVRRHPREYVFNCRADMQITFKDEIIKLDHGEMLEIPEYIDRYQIHTDYDSIIVVAGGIWDDPAGSSGVFTMLPSKAPENTGDPSEYNRNTRFDRHFHDCDEYWIITQGNCVAEIDGVLCALTPGNCLYIPKGVSHDLLRVPKMVSGVYIETSMKGQRRSGHLWKHTHG